MILRKYRLLLICLFPPLNLLTPQHPCWGCLGLTLGDAFLARFQRRGLVPSNGSTKIIKEMTLKTKGEPQFLWRFALYIKFFNDLITLARFDPSR